MRVKKKKEVPCSYFSLFYSEWQPRCGVRRALPDATCLFDQDFSDGGLLFQTTSSECEGGSMPRPNLPSATNSLIVQADVSTEGPAACMIQICTFL